MDLNDDALGLVLERVDSHASLIRAAAVCRRWRRTIADDAFLHRFRSLHVPAIAGDYHSRPRSALLGATRTGDGPRSGFVPSSPPVADARHFALDFLPDGGKDWTVVDSRGSLVMMCRRDVGAFLGFPDQLVCEPLTRRYRRIPLPPDLGSPCEFYSSYLVDGGGDTAGGGVISMSNFRVVCMLYRGGGAARAAVFRAIRRHDGEAADSSWSERAIDDHILEMNCYAFHLGRAGGSWYLYQARRRTLIVLDGRTGEFSSSELTAVDEDWSSTACSLNSAVTEGRDGEPRILFMAAEEGIAKVLARINNGEWALEKRVVLSEVACGLPGYEPPFVGNLFVMTKGVGSITFSLLSREAWFFSLDLATMEATPVSEDMGDMMFRCELPWPPALHACLS